MPKLIKVERIRTYWCAGSLQLWEHPGPVYDVVWKLKKSGIVSLCSRRYELGLAVRDFRASADELTAQ